VAAAVPGLRDRVAGLAGATPGPTDAHKWLNVPYDSGIVIVRNRRGAPRGHDARGGLLTSRPRATSGDGYKLGAGIVAPGSRLRRLRSPPVAGRDGLAEMIERCCTLARRMADGLRRAAGVTVLNEVVLNQVLVRFEPPGAATPTRSRGR